MSYYEDDRREDRRRRDRRKDPAYEEEEIIAARSGPKGSKHKGALVPRGRDSSSDSSIEEVRRDFPPAGYDRSGSYDRRRDHRPKRAKSARETKRGGRYDDDYSDDYYDDRRRRGKKDRRRDYSSSSSSRSPPRKERRKSVGEQALGALGLGGAGGAVLASAFRSKSQDRGGGHRSSKRDRKSRRRSSSSSSSSRSRSRNRRRGRVDPKEQLMQAAKAAAIAGGTEAWRMRKEPGDWKGAKGRRVLTAAVGAAGVDRLIDKDPNEKGTMHTIQSAIAGLAGNRVLHGSRNDERSRSRSRGRGRSESHGGGGIGGISAGAIAPIAVAAAKQFMGGRSKSRGRGKRDYSSSDDDRAYRRSGGRRSKSVSDYMRQGVAALGIGGNRFKRDTTDGRSSSPDSYHAPRSQLPAAASRARGGAVPPVTGTNTRSLKSSSSSTSLSSTEEEKEKKQLGRKQLITAGLASVATIHAAHNVYQSVHQRKELAQDVADGEISPQEARRKRNKGRLKQAASIGVAALGVRGAYSEWKEMQEQRHEAINFKAKMERKRQRRSLRAQGHILTPNSDDSTSDLRSGGGGASSGLRPPTSYPNGAPPPEYRRSAPDLASPGPSMYSPYPDSPSPRYEDANPYHGQSQSHLPNREPPPEYR